MVRALYTHPFYHIYFCRILVPAFILVQNSIDPRLVLLPCASPGTALGVYPELRLGDRVSIDLAK